MHRDLLFTYDFPPMGGGISRWMGELERNYPGSRLTVSTGMTPISRQNLGQPEGNVDRIGVSSERLKTIYGSLRWSHRAVQLSRDPSVRFAWCGQVRPAATPAWWAKQRTGLPYGLILHGGDLLSLIDRAHRKPSKRRQLTALFREASLLVANSQWTASKCGELLELLSLVDGADRLQVVPPGTDAERFSPASDVSTLRRNLLMLTVARLVPHKGIDTAIRVLSALREEFPTLHYSIVGNGPHESDLRHLVSSLGVGDRVRFITDLADDALPALYREADLYLGLSRATGNEVEGFGISLLEAAASGLPVVAGASGGTADAIADGVSGFLVDPENVEAAVGIVRHLLTQPDLRQQLGMAGRARVLDRFTSQHVGKSFDALAASHGRKL